jgi:hypothetical protein
MTQLGGHNMDHDAISIPELNDDDLKQQVNDALIAHREWRETGNIDGLGHCKLAQNPLIQAFGPIIEKGWYNEFRVSIQYLSLFDLMSF